MMGQGSLNIFSCLMVIFILINTTCKKEVVHDSKATQEGFFGLFLQDSFLEMERKVDCKVTRIMNPYKMGYACDGVWEVDLSEIRLIGRQKFFVSIYSEDNQKTHSIWLYLKCKRAEHCNEIVTAMTESFTKRFGSYKERHYETHVARGWKRGKYAVDMHILPQSFDVRYGSLIIFPFETKRE